MSNKIISGKIQAISNKTFGVMINSKCGKPLTIISDKYKPDKVYYCSQCSTDELIMLGGLS